MTVRAAVAIALVLVALAACAAPSPPPPWAGRDPAELVELVVLRRAFAERGGEEEFEPDRESRIALAEAVARAVPVPSDKVAPAVASVRYALSFLAKGAAWRLELAGEDVFAHATTPSVPPRHYRAPQLRALLDLAFARWDAATTRDLASFTPRLARFFDRARARALADGQVLELLGAPRTAQLTLASGERVTLEPSFLVLVAPTGRESLALALPRTVQVHAGYAAFRAVFTPAGESAVVGVPDRDGRPDSDDPARWQPFPLHHDLVLTEPETGRAVFVDVRPRELVLRLR